MNQRDNLIEDLMWSLQHALSVRDNLASQLNSINAMEIPCKDSDKNKCLEEKVRKLYFLSPQNKEIFIRKLMVSRLIL